MCRALLTLLVATFLVYEGIAYEDRILEAPYIALIQYTKRQESWDGVIITSKYVLTSASRVMGKNESQLLVHAGTLSNTVKVGSEHPVAKIKIHKNFSRRDPLKLHDLALLKLRNFIPFDTTRQPIPLLGNIEKFGVNGNVMEYHLKIQNYIHRRNLSLPILRNDKCNQAVADASVKKSQICAGFINQPEGTCVGNFSGPLVINKEVAGIFSHNLVCGPETFLGIFTDVGIHRDWIRKNSDLRKLEKKIKKVA